MRELVYLSNNKLGQFVEDKPRRRWWPGAGKVTINLPVGSLELEHANSEDVSRRLPEKQLATVASHLELSARWYEDSKVSAGEWVVFDVPLMAIEHQSVVLFIDPVDVRSPLRTRLLLHGSSASLLPHRSDWADTVIDAWSVPSPKPSQSAFVNELECMVRSMGFDAAHLGPSTKGVNDPDRSLRQDVSSVISILDRKLSPVTAAWMSGLARVSAVFPEQDAGMEPLAECGVEVGGSIVVASPLFVERVEAPRD